jgi:Fungal chitosanase of glycosyl hydrolase group 75
VVKAFPGVFTAVALALIAPALAQPTCGTSAGITLRDKGNDKPVRKVGSALVFTSGLRVNTDGAANSYHPLGRPHGALNTLCNGLAVTPKTGPFAGQRISALGPAAMSGAERCRTILEVFRRSMQADYAILPDAEIHWFAIAMRPPQAGKYRPCIQQSGSFAGFFVAQTSRPADPGRDVCDPARWISSTEIPYVTLPGDRLRGAGVSPGDLALVHRRQGTVDHLIVAVAGDTGNRDELGEGSVALHRALGNESSGTLPGNISNGVTTFLFPMRRVAPPITAARLEAEKDALVAAVGGSAAVASCYAGT